LHDKTVLENGVSILTIPMPHTRSVSVGIFTGVGSRYESHAQRGMSHFIEHMVFKGTKRRPTAQTIAESIEGLGGLLNASTGNELTTYWAKVADRHFQLASDVLQDIFRNSLFEPTEVEKERHVILQEISRLMDDPDSWVHVLMADLMWPDHPVGWEIAGTRETVGQMTRQDLVDYWANNYAPGNTVVSVAGNVSHETVVNTFGSHLADWTPLQLPSCLPAQSAPSGPTVRVQLKETEQAHLCVGLRGLPLEHPEYFPLRVLNVILGEGMSSRLFLEIREKQGLAYSVGSYSSSLTDTGALVLHAGALPERAAEVVVAMLEQLDRLRQDRVPHPELTKSKEYLKGRILLHMEDTFSNAQWFGRQEVLRQTVETVDQVIARLDAVTVEQVQSVAQQLFRQDELRLAIIGPFDHTDLFDRVLQLP